MTLKASTLIGLALLALALALWLGRDLPAVQQALPSPLRQALREGPAPLPPQAGAHTSPRKCRQGERVIYTDGDCPAGTHEQALAGGTVSVLPAAPAAAPASVVAASAATPLRRLAGEGGLPDQAGRMADQALQR
jgi:hypothetical protein